MLNDMELLKGLGETDKEGEVESLRDREGGGELERHREGGRKRVRETYRGR